MNARVDCSALPWSAEAEHAVLGGLMIDADAMLRIADRHLQAGHFFDGRHREIFAAITDLSARRHPADVVTVFEHLQGRGAAEGSADLGYLNAMAQSVPSASNIGRYTDIVLDKAMRRAIVAPADLAQELAHEPGEADALLDRVASLFAGIQRTRAAAAPKRLDELLGARIDHWQSLADGETAPGIPTGLDNLDEALAGGLKPGKVLVLAARPSVGKTSLAGQIGLNVAGLGHTVLMLSQEMQAGDLVDRTIANLGRIRLDGLVTGQMENDEWTRITEATEVAARLPFFIDDQPALTILDIRSKARQVKQRAGLALVIVDYLQLCSSSGGFDKRHHQIEQISRGMKQLAKELGVCVLLLSQLVRADDREPELDHLKESGAIEEDADTVILLHPMGVEDDGAQLILAKVPKNRQGRRGRLALTLAGKTQRWEMSMSNVSRSHLSRGAQ